MACKRCSCGRKPTKSRIGKVVSWLFVVSLALGAGYVLSGCNHDSSDGDDSYYGTFDSHSVWDGCHWNE